MTLSTLIDPHQPVIPYQHSLAVSNRIQLRFKSLTQTISTPIDPCRPAWINKDPDVNLVKSRQCGIRKG